MPGTELLSTSTHPELFPSLDASYRCFVAGMQSSPRFVSFAPRVACNFVVEQEILVFFDASFVSLIHNSPVGLAEFSKFFALIYQSSFISERSKRIFHLSENYRTCAGRCIDEKISSKSLEFCREIENFWDLYTRNARNFSKF